MQESCASIAPKLKPVGFQLSDFVFELQPELYLYKASATQCYFVVHKCKLPGKNANLFLVGDVFLRHFYSVYDFDNDQIGLGINTHSEGRVALYKPGERPADSAVTETAAADVTDGEEQDVEMPTTTDQQTSADVHTSDKTQLRASS